MPSLRHQYIDRGWNCLYFLTLRQATAVSQGKGFTANCYIAFATDLSASILMNICIGKSIVTFTQLLSEPIVSRLFLWRQNDDRGCPCRDSSSKLRHHRRSLLLFLRSKRRTAGVPRFSPVTSNTQSPRSPKVA